MAKLPRQTGDNEIRLWIKLTPPDRLLPGRIEHYVALKYDCDGRTVYNRDLCRGLFTIALALTEFAGEAFQFCDGDVIFASRLRIQIALLAIEAQATGQLFEWIGAWPLGSGQCEFGFIICSLHGDLVPSVAPLPIPITSLQASRS